MKVFDVKFNYPGHNREGRVTVKDGQRIEEAIKEQYNLTYGQSTNIVIYKKTEVI